MSIRKLTNAEPAGVYVVENIGVGGMSGVTAERIWLPMCETCGALILGVDAHRDACPGITPPPKPPVPYVGTIAEVIDAHRDITYPGTVGCSCNLHARFADHRGYSGHVAQAIADALGGAQ
ncbi:hypothetical protein ACQ856_18280 [Mycolicibacterium psychrotolerans]|uniref:hypothetical protein n=1 Tax=Mycolicibacterium psychrotolerans TaxID=216929 RepID=UPI003D67670B